MTELRKLLIYKCIDNRYVVVDEPNKWIISFDWDGDDWSALLTNLEETPYTVPISEELNKLLKAKIFRDNKLNSIIFEQNILKKFQTKNKTTVEKDEDIIFECFNPWNAYMKLSEVQGDIPAGNDSDLKKARDSLLVFLTRALKLQDFQEAALITNWIIATYRGQDFRAFPYLIFTGVPGSGKTRALELISHFSYRGLLAASISVPALVRVLHYKQCTLCIDQLERKISTRSKNKEDFEQIVLSSHTRNQKYIVADKDSSDEILFYDVTGPKAFSTIKLPQEEFTSRSFIIGMTPQKPEYMDYETYLPELEWIRTVLLSYHDRVEPVKYEPTKKFGRDRDLLLPLISIEHDIFGLKEHKTMEQCLERSRACLSSVSETDGNRKGIINAIFTLTKENPKFVTIKDINKITKIESITIGADLNNMGLIKKKRNVGQTITISDNIKKLQDLYKYYGVVK